MALVQPPERSLGVCLGALLAVGCMEFSPFETDLADHERDRTNHNLARLVERGSPGSEFRFALIADSHERVDELAGVVDRLEARDDLELVIHLGDMTDYGLREEYRWALGELERLSVPYFTTIGNHDALSNGRFIYRAMFGPYDYVFEHGRIRFVLFNANTLEFGREVPRIEWVGQQTAAASGRTLAFAHQRPNEAVPEYDGVLRDNGADLLATGHRHRTRRFDLHGLTAIEVGTTMASDYVIVTVTPRSLALEGCRRDHCQPIPP